MARLSFALHETLTEDVLSTLFNKKIYTVTDFLESDVKMLTKVTNITYKEIIDIKNQILNIFAAKINYGNNYYNYLLKNRTITPTNLQNFDNLIGGGYISGSIYEICGFTSTGKTQFCLTSAINISQFSQKPVYYIDSKRDFSSKRLQQILEIRKCIEEDIPGILNRIKIKQINDQHQLISSLFDIKNEMLNNFKCPLIIIDSLPAIFYHTGNYNTTLTTMNHFVNIIRFISVELNTAFLVTNIIINDSSQQKSNTTSTSSVSIKPGLGAYWNSVPNTRLLIEKNYQNICKMTVLKSTTIECNKMCEVTITDCGVV